MLGAGEVLSFKIAKDWIARLYDELKRVGTQRKTELRKIGDVFGDPDYLSRFYVEPDCQQFNPADDNEDESPVIIRQPILSTIHAYLSGPATHSRNQMFILSDAGMGKTSVLVMLKLAHLTNFWPNQYACELLKLGAGTLDDIAKIENKINTILLLDALDEDPLAWSQIDRRLGEILRATTTFRRVLITCRSQFFSAGDDPFNRFGQVEVAGFICPVIYNSLFTAEQTEAYLERRATEHPHDDSWILKARDIVSGMGSLRMRPMLLAHVEDFLESGESRWTEYTIYKALIRTWLNREQKKFLNADQSRPSVTELWSACRQLAIFLQSQHKLRISEDELAALIQQFPEVGSVPFMHIGGRSLLNKDSQGNYRFSHFSVQEFLLVDAVVEGGSTIDPELIRTTVFMSRLAAAWLREGRPRNARRIAAFIPSLKNSDFAGANLKGCDFSGMCLDGSDFSGADLTDASFVDASLRGCKMDGTVLRNAILKRAILDEAVLTDVNAERAEFQWASLRNARFTRAALNRANFNFAKLTGATYDGSTTWPGNVFPLDEGAILVK